MMRSHVTPEAAERDFLEWTSLFTGSLFMKLVAYADDSGTHDVTGVLPGSQVGIIAGIVAPIEEWGVFCKKWRAALNRFEAEYFHFCEWSAASSVVRGKRKPDSSFNKGNPYRKWSQSKLDDFIVELATIAGAGNKVIVGMGVSTPVFHAAKIDGSEPKDSNPYEQCADRFLSSVITEIARQRPPWKRQPISLFFDQSDKHFRDTVTDMFFVRKKSLRTLKEITFADKKEHLPLQAADMIAYRARQTTETWMNGDDRYWEAVDSVLFKPYEPFVIHNELELRKRLIAGKLDYPNSEF